MQLDENLCRKMNRSHAMKRLKKKAQHSKRVRRFSEQIVDQLEEKGMWLDSDLLNKAALLHDIAKFDDEKKHNRKAKKAIAKEYKKYTQKDMDKQELKELGAVIKAHKGTFDPPKSVALEAAVLRMADKIDKTARAEKKAKKAYKKHLHDIKKSHLLGGKKNFKRFKKACKKVRKEVKAEFQSK